MPIIRLAKVNKAIELYQLQLRESRGLSVHVFTNEFMNAAHAFNELNPAEKTEMMRLMGFSEEQIKEVIP